jgi:hypothetical protein
MLAMTTPPHAAPAIVISRPAVASARPLKVRRNFGGLAFLHTGSALKAKGIKIDHRIALSCAAVAPPARVACGNGWPGLTPMGGTLDPGLASGSVTTNADVKFVRGSRSVALRSATVSASHGVLTVSARIGGRTVALGTATPRAQRTVSDVNLANRPLLLTAAGAAALGHALGTSLKAGGQISAFGGNVVFTEANVVSGTATLNLPGQVTATPTGTASGGAHAINLTVLPGVLALSHGLESLTGTLHLSGGMSLSISGRTVTVTGLSVTLHGDKLDQHRTDVLSATVNGHHIALANMKEASGAADDSGKSETDSETTVTLTASGAAALGSPFKSGSKFGTVDVFANVGS